MKVCAVLSCRKDSSKCPGLTFFNLPRDPCAKGEWLDALRLKHNEGSQNIKVCENHFRSKDFCAGKRQLKTHAVPVLNLGVGKVEPLDSDDEFMHCDSDNDELLLEVKKLTAAEAMMDRKIKREQEEKPQEEQETGRRPSRRAAREAAKKIYNTARNYGCVADNDDSEVISSAKASTSTARLSTSTARLTPRQRRAYQAIKVPPPNIDLVMECHEELLSTVQAEALLQAQLQYNMVMKSLRSMKANNVRIICQSADEPVVTESSEDIGAHVKNHFNDNSSNSRSPNIVIIQAAKKENESVYPMELSTNVPSPAPILS